MENHKGTPVSSVCCRERQGWILVVTVLSLLGEAMLLLLGLISAYSDCYSHSNMISQDITKVPPKPREGGVQGDRIGSNPLSMLLFLHKNGDEDIKAVERPGL